MSTTASAPHIQPLDAESLYDSIGPAYDSAFATCSAQQNSVTWLLEHLPPHASILDIGCGTGRPVCSALASGGHSVHGIDISGAMLAAAEKNVPNASFQKIDVKDFSPAVDMKYDAITVYYSLIASVTQQEIRSCFGKIFSWLKPDGLFVFATVPISGESLEIRWMGRPVVVSSLSRDEALEAIKAVGFEVLEEEISHFWPNAVEAGICAKEDVWEEEHLFVYAKKKR